MTDKEIIKILSKRIHNQRVALRENWMIIEERIKSRSVYSKPYWFRKVLRQNRQLSTLNDLVVDLKEELEFWAFDMNDPPEITLKLLSKVDNILNGK